MFQYIEGNEQENKTLKRKNKKRVLKAKEERAALFWALFHRDSDYERETERVYKSGITKKREREEVGMQEKLLILTNYGLVD